jgi:hypothetical protein
VHCKVYYDTLVLWLKIKMYFLPLRIMSQMFTKFVQNVKRLLKFLSISCFRASIFANILFSPFYFWTWLVTISCLLSEKFFGKSRNFRVSFIVDFGTSKYFFGQRRRNPRYSLSKHRRNLALVFLFFFHSWICSFLLTLDILSRSQLRHLHSKKNTMDICWNKKC